MEKIDLRFQVALFGNFDDITPNLDNIKFFLETYADRNLIPNQVQEVNIDAISGTSSNSNRLNLTSSDQSWNVRFSFDRMDAILTNANIGVTEMEERQTFVESFMDVFTKFNTQYPKKLKRIGFVCQHLISDISINDVAKKVNTQTSFYDETSSIEFSNKVVNRSSIKIPHEELINVSSELRWLKTNLKIEDKNQPFEGLLYATDINSIPENTEYRFDQDNVAKFLEESSKIADQINEEYYTLIK